MITINPRKLVSVNTRGEAIFRGGLSTQAELGAQNVRQFGRFLRTPQGARFLAQQFLLQAENPIRRKNIIKPADDGTGEIKTATEDLNTRLYNPAAPLIAKGLSQELTSIKPTRHIGTFRGNPIESRTDNAVKFFKTGGKGAEVDLQVRYGGSGIEKSDLEKYPNRNGELGDEVKDFIKFRIRDAVNGKYIIFPALLEGNISDNSSTTPSEIQYIGRPDKVYVYGGYTRTISFSVNIVAQADDDIPIIWEKINYAKGLVLPQYREFFSNKSGTDSDTTRPVAPICYLTLGDLFVNTPGFFTSVNLAIPEGSTWTLQNGKQVPHICTLAFEFTFIGKDNPTMTSNHYDGNRNNWEPIKPETDSA